MSFLIPKLYGGTKRLEIISRLLIVVFFVIVLFRSFAWEPPIITCFGKDISVLIWLFPIILAIIIEFVAFYIQKKHNLSIRETGKSFLKFLLFFLILSFLFSSIFLCTLCAPRGKAVDARRQSDIRQISLAQEIFHEKKERYAISQEEFIKEGVLESVIVDPQTKIEYTDEDGEGLEGGDNDPNTWSVQAALMGYNYEICSKELPKRFYICNQEGCREKVKD